MAKNDDLTKLANGSGFVFQIGLEHAIRDTSDRHDWEVVSREHPWTLGHAEGFVDLVLRKGLVTGVVECKRTTDGRWLFLVPEGQGQEATRIASRSVWIFGRNDVRLMSGWDGIEHLPASYVSTFCVVRGTGENNRPLLERLCSTLLNSVDALAEQETSILQEQKLDAWGGFYLPMIVTTAELHVCRFAPGTIDLSKGTIPNANYETVPYIRFQKAFSTSMPPGTKPGSLEKAATANERTVLVIQADRFIEFLSLIQEPQLRNPYPWEKRLRQTKTTSP